MDPGRWEEKPVTHSKTMNYYQRPLKDDTPQVLEDHRLDDISAPAIHRYVNILMDKWFKKIRTVTTRSSTSNASTTSGPDSSWKCR